MEAQKQPEQEEIEHFEKDRAQTAMNFISKMYSKISTASQSKSLQSPSQDRFLPAE